MRKFAAAMILGLLIADPAVAQVATEPSPWGRLWMEIQVAVVPAIGLILTALIAWVASWVKEKFKVDVEQKWRDALHGAIMSGILLGLSRVGVVLKPGGETEPLTTSQAAEVNSIAVAYAKTSAGDAIANLKATDSKLSEVAEAKLEGVMTGVVVPAVPGTSPAPAPTT